MKILACTGKAEVAKVYLAEFEDGQFVEFVEAVQPPIPRDEKWVLLVSTLYGCPVECLICDAGGFYAGKVSKERIFAQIDHIVDQHFPDGVIPCKQFKIQFSRMGEPAFNQDILDVLEELPQKYTAPGLMPSISSIAPRSTKIFFEQLLEIKRALYAGGHFQFQFSLHTTDQELREKLIPVKKWDFAQMAAYGEKFYQPGDRKITLNFALAKEVPVDPAVLLTHFDPDKFLIKITPLNPTYSALEHGLTSYIDPHAENDSYPIIDQLEAAGYQVIVSIGEIEENQIGSNCGQYVKKHIKASQKLKDGYSYAVEAGNRESMELGLAE